MRARIGRIQAGASVVLVLLLGLAVLAVPALAGGHQDRVVSQSEWSWRLAPDKIIEIEGVNGSIHAVGTSGPDVVVHATKRAHRSDPDQVKVEILQHADGITLCVHYPDRWGHRNQCAPGGKSRMDTHNNDVSVDFEVQVPARVRFVGRAVNGEVEGLDLGADAEAHTVNGSIVLETRGRAEATTVNGSVRARLGSLGAHGPVDFTTVNGSITLELPDNAGAEVAARNVNGGIHTDFPLTIRSRGFVGSRLEGTIGGGGPRLNLETVNGAIELRRAKSL